jgi:glutamine synthetase
MCAEEAWMDSKSFVAVCFSDLAGQIRGHGVPRATIEEMYQRGLPWPADLAALTVFGDAVDTPWDSNGGLNLLPDASSEVTIDFGGAEMSESFVLGSIQTADQKAWGGCTRSFLQACLDTLKQEFNLDVSCNYEHQFTLHGNGSAGSPAMSLSALRRERQFAIVLATVLENAGITLVRFGAGIGEEQFTATTRAKFGVSAADSAVIFRQLVHATAERLGQRCSFAPLSSKIAAQNGMMLGLDLYDDGDKVSHDATMPNGVSAVLGSFMAGIQRHLPALTALTRPSLLVAGTGGGETGNGHRPARKTPRHDAAISINPALRTSAKRDYSFAFTAADATACPYLQLGALICAGLQGLREALPTPDFGTTGAAAANGSGGNGTLQSDLPAALLALDKDEVFGKTFPDGLLDAYVSVKQAELETASHMSPAELNAWCQEIY